MIVMTWLRGDAREHTSTASAGGGESEGTVYSISDGTLTWTSDGRIHTGDATVDLVVNEWMETGECTPGWVIRINNVRVC